MVQFANMNIFTIRSTTIIDFFAFFYPTCYIYIVIFVVNQTLFIYFFS